MAMYHNYNATTKIYCTVLYCWYHYYLQDYAASSGDEELQNELKQIKNHIDAAKKRAEQIKSKNGNNMDTTNDDVETIKRLIFNRERSLNSVYASDPDALTRYNQL